MKTAITVALLILASSAFAASQTGNELSQGMTTANRMAQTPLFRGYVAGVQDVFEGKLFCVPDDVPPRQSAAVVAKYLADHPEYWNQAAKLLVANALKSAFPCDN